MKKLIIPLFCLLASASVWGQTNKAIHRGQTETERTGTQKSGTSSLKARARSAIDKYMQLKKAEYRTFMRDQAKGDAEAMFQLGECYRWDGSAVKFNENEAKKWYTMAAEKGHAKAMFRLGRDTKDAKEKLEWFRRSAEAGGTKAMCELGEIYVRGYYGVEKDGEKGIDYYNEAAEKGDLDAMHELGVCYQFGKGTLVDMEKAHEWYKKRIETMQKGAEDGNIDSMVKLGWMYHQGYTDFQGNLLPKDYTKAMEWFKKATDKGEGDAMWAIGCMYEDGEGVAMSKTKAVEWWIRGAEAGSLSAVDGLKYYLR